MRDAVALVAVVGVACGVGASERSSRNREAQVVPILEAVFRYEIYQFVDKAQESAATAVCHGVAEGKRIVDPPEGLVGRRGLGSRVLPLSKCSGAEPVRLNAGPIEWQSDGEVRVSGSFQKSMEGTVPLVYRVMLDSGKWSCAGPIIAYDPL
jgi:hypothetical protein